MARRKVTRQKRHTGRSTRRPEFYSVESPFVGMPIEDIISGYAASGHHAQEQFPGLLDELEAAVRKFDPIRLLSAMAFYGPSGIGMDEWATDSPILQCHLELVQALALRRTREELGARPPLPDEVEEVHTLVQAVNRAFSRKRAAGLDASASVEERLRFLTLETIRWDTQAIRGWGYTDQIASLVRAVCAPFEGAAEETLGVRLASVVEMYSRVVQIAADRISAHIRRLSPVFRANSIKSAVDRFVHSFPEFAPLTDELLDAMRSNRVPLADAKLRLYAVADIRLAELYQFTDTDFADAYPGPVDAAALKSLLDKWSLSFGDLADTDPSKFLLGNPIWTRPFVRLPTGELFIPNLNGVHSFIWELIECLLQPYPGLLERYEKARPRVLESQLRRLLTEAFPGAKIMANSLWTDPSDGEERETDLIVQISSYLLIFEAKSGGVTASARRGAPERLKRTLKDLLVAPALQAARLRDYLLANPGAHRFRSAKGGVNEFDTSTTQHIVPVSVLLEPLASLQNRVAQLRDAGFIASSDAMAVTFTLPDLETVFSILEGTAQKLHYLVRRAEFEQVAEFIGDELDLLGCYLETGFHLGEATSDHRFVLTGLSRSVDAYFMQEGRRAVAKPQLRLTPWWRSMLNEVEKNKPDQWTELGFALLQVSYEDQVRFEREFRRLRQRVRRYRDRSGHEDARVCFCGPATARVGMVGFIYDDMPRAERDERIRGAADYALEQENLTVAVVVGQRLDRPRDPYDVLACALPPAGD